ncbi:MAG: hypothetical protein IJA59_06120 [Clostridia bacterium]|nr:hypothetical protein [Clostridia bacterium]
MPKPLAAPAFLGFWAGGKPGGKAQRNLWKSGVLDLFSVCKQPIWMKASAAAKSCADFLPKYDPKRVYLAGLLQLSTLSPFAVSTKSGPKNRLKPRVFNTVHKLCTMLSTVLVEFGV